jgi:hypothetical protein
MDKWKEYKTYENWKYRNIEWLKREFEKRRHKLEQCIEPSTFDDFCMGQWQGL